MRRSSIRVRGGLFLLALFVGVWGTGPSSAQGPEPAVDYTPTTGITRTGNPARADYAGPSSWALCSGTFALCYYSGPEPAAGQPDLSCEVTEGPKKMANCKCLHFADHDNWVDIDGILDKDVYEATVAFCQAHDCTSQAEKNKAPVCGAINGGTLFPGVTTDAISTFSKALNKPGTPYWIDPTDCPRGKYAGCMTAPCVASDQPPVEIEGTTYDVDICTCPTWTEAFFVGSSIEQSECQLGNGDPGSNVWSAATNEMPTHIVSPDE